jgi:membrane protease YdiL (CAAX protease family)
VPLSLDPVLGVLMPSPDPHHIETPTVQSRRRVLVAAVLVLGAVLLSIALNTPHGSNMFFVLTLALPLVWGLGSWATGPLHLGRRAGRRALFGPVVVAVGLWLVFVAGDQLFRLVPFLADQVAEILRRADDGPLWLAYVVALSNAVGEEAFYRGALYSACGRHNPVLWSTVVNVAVTAASGNLALCVAAAFTGTVFGLERRATRGFLAPMITHLAWSALMLAALPR